MEPSLTGKSGANERNESSLSNCRVQPALSKKEGRDDFRTLRLFHHVPKEQRITNNISPPHALRFFQQAIEPFQTMLLPPHWCTLHGTSKEVKHSPYSPGELHLTAKYMQIFKSKHHHIISNSPFSKYLQCYPENSTYKSFLCDQ